MKVEVTISDISQENLVDLFSVALYGSDRFFARVKRKDYEPLRCAGDCIEDKLAKVLLNGGSIYVFDKYADDENDFYGNPVALTHEYSEEDEAMCYTVKLPDVEDGLARAYESQYACDYLKHLMYDPCQMDITEADALLQFVLFGEVIYG